MRASSRDSRQGVPFAAIDIGGTKVACVIGQLIALDTAAPQMEILGLGQQGAVAFGPDADMEEALKGALEAAERMAKVRVDEAWVAARGRSIGSRRLGVDLDLSGRVVTSDDIADCLAAGAKAAVVEGARALHATPIRYLVDGETTTGKIDGMIGDTLSAEMLGLSVRDSYAANLDALATRAGLTVREIVAAPYAAGEAVLLDDEKELGVLLLDIGARSTDFAVYDRGVLVACGASPLGGEHITRDIAQIFGSPLRDAERIKTMYGSAFIPDTDDHWLIDFPQLGSPGDIARHSRADLSAVISSRLDEIYEMSLNAAAEKLGDRLSINRAVLTGGGSLMVGAREAAEAVLKVKARLGRPSLLAGAPEAARAPQYAVAIGMLHLARASVAVGAAKTGLMRDWRAESTGSADFIPGPRMFREWGAWMRAHF